MVYCARAPPGAASSASPACSVSALMVFLIRVKISVSVGAGVASWLLKSQGVTEGCSSGCVAAALFLGEGPGVRRCKKIDIFPFVLWCPLFLHRLMSCGPWPLRPIVRGAGIAHTFSASTPPGRAAGKDVPGRPHLRRGRQRAAVGAFSRPELLRKETHAGGSVTARRPVRPFVLAKSPSNPGTVAA